MRIGMVTTTYPRFAGDGAGSYTHLLVESLREIGHEVRVVAPAPGGAMASDDLLGDVCRVRHTNPLSARIAYGAGIVENLRANPWLAAGLPAFLAELRRAVAQNLADCDVLDASFTAAGMAVALARRSNQVIVYTGHGTDVHLVERVRPYRWVFREMLRRFDAVTVVSRALADALVRTGCCHRPIVMPNGVANDTFRSRSDWRERPTVIFASRFIDIKQPELLVRAWALLAPDVPHARLIMFGDGPRWQAVRDSARKLGVLRAIDFRGPVPAATVWEEMGKGWLTVLPSREEGWPPLLLESLAAGTPFLATPVGSIPELAEQTGGGLLLPDVPSEAAVALAIRDALEDKGQLQARGMQGCERVKALYAWDEIARRRAELYARLADGADDG